MLKRRRFKQTVSLRERLLLFAQEARQKAEALPPGAAREQLLKKADQAETAAEQDGWVGPADASLTTGSDATRAVRQA